MSDVVVFIDTNLFLRFLTNDIPSKATDVENLLHEAAEGNITLITNSLVLAEIVWTLESYYKLERESIYEKVLAILNSPGLKVPDANLVFKAIAWYAEKKVDFIDAYNAAWMTQHQIRKVYTFDQKHFSRFEEIEIEQL